nr:unnamed protein product [Callosobruchus analis]
MANILHTFTKLVFLTVNTAHVTMKPSPT